MKIWPVKACCRLKAVKFERFTNLKMVVVAVVINDIRLGLKERNQIHLNLPESVSHFYSAHKTLHRFE